MNKKIAILVDSSSSLSPALKSRLNKDLFQISLSILDENQKEYLDNDELSQEKVLKMLAENKRFKTSCSNLGRLYQTLETILSKFDQVIFIPISHGLSGQYQQSLIVQEEYPDRFFVVKNKTAICGTEYITQYAFDKIQKEPNLDLNKLVIELENLNLRINAYFSCEILTTLLSSGRTSRAIVKVAQFLRLKPIICMDTKNMLSGSGTNYKNIITKIVTIILPKLYKDKWDTKIIDKVYVCSSGCSEEKINDIKKIASDKLHYDINKIEVRPVPNVVMVHTNFDSYGIFVVTKIDRLVTNAEKE